MSTPHQPAVHFHGNRSGTSVHEMTIVGIFALVGIAVLGLSQLAHVGCCFLSMYFVCLARNVLMTHILQWIEQSSGPVQSIVSFYYWLALMRRSAKGRAASDPGPCLDACAVAQRLCQLMHRPTT